MLFGLVFVFVESQVDVIPISQEDTGVEFDGDTSPVIDPAGSDSNGVSVFLVLGVEEVSWFLSRHGFSLYLSRYLFRTWLTPSRMYSAIGTRVAPLSSRSSSACVLVR